MLEVLSGGEPETDWAPAGRLSPLLVSAHRPPWGGTTCNHGAGGGGCSHQQTLHFIFGPTHRRSRTPQWRNQVWKMELVLIWYRVLSREFQLYKMSVESDFYDWKSHQRRGAAGRVLGWGELLAPLSAWPGSWVEGGGGRNLSSDEILTHLHHPTHSHPFSAQAHPNLFWRETVNQKKLAVRFVHRRT